VRGIVIKFDKAVVVEGLPYHGHVVCVFRYPTDNDLYVVDNSPQSCMHGPYKSEEEAANKSCFPLVKISNYYMLDINLSNGTF